MATTTTKETLVPKATNKLLLIQEEFKKKMASEVQNAKKELQTSLEAVEVIYASITAAGENNIWQEPALEPVLGKLGLVDVGAIAASTATEGGKSKRLRGDKKENLKPVLLKVIKSAMSRKEIEASAEVVAYCKSVGIDTVPNVAPILAELETAKQIDSEGKKTKKKYKPV